MKTYIAIFMDAESTKVLGYFRTIKNARAAIKEPGIKRADAAIYRINLLKDYI